MKKLLVLILGIVLIAGVLSGCTEEEDKDKDTDDDDDTTTNTAPVLNETITCDATNVSNISMNVEVTFMANATDADDDTLTYHWRIVNESGENITTANTTNLAYNFTETGTYTVKVKVSDGTVTTDETELEVKVVS